MLISNHWFSPLQIFNSAFLCDWLLSCACYFLHPPYPPCFHHTRNIQLKTNITKFLVLQSPPPLPQLPVTSCLLYHYPLSSRFLNTLNIIYLFIKKKHTFNEQHSKSFDVLTAVCNEITVFKCDWVYFATILNSDVSVLTRNSEYRVYFSTLNTKAPGFEER